MTNAEDHGSVCLSLTRDERVRLTDQGATVALIEIPRGGPVWRVTLRITAPKAVRIEREPRP